MPSSRRCVFGCVTKGLTVHSFPNPSKLPEQFRIWVELGGEQLKNLSGEEIYKRLKVCDKHFIDSHRNRNIRLNALAIPTLHLSHQLSNTENKIDNIVYATVNNPKKENIQEEIVIEIDVPAKSKKRRIFTRAGHNKGFKRPKSSSRDGAKKPRPWHYEKQRLLNVKQLKRYLLRRAHIKRASNSTLNSLCSTENNVYTISYIAASSASSVKNEEGNLHSRESQVPRPSSSNAVHSFFTAMADVVVTFPPDVQLKIKNQLYSTVWQAALELKQHPNVAGSSSE